MTIEERAEQATDMALRVYGHPGLISRILTPDEAERAARQVALDPSVFDGRAPFFWTAVISNNALDAYVTRMLPSTLRNFAADAAAGVSFQNSHVTRQLGFGRSISGEFMDEGEGLSQRVVADFYTIPGLNLNGVTTDDFITAVRAGVVKDVSVGFYGGTIRCSLCGRDYWDWDCPHVFGVTYTTLDSQGREGEPEMAVGLIDGARLSEVSIVYDGATPGAEIIAVKAQREADAGRLRPETARYLEQRYRLALPGVQRSFAGATPQPAPAPEGGSDMSGTEARQPETPAAVDVWAEVRSVLTAHAALGEAEEPREAVVRLATEAARLRQLADDGRQYRADLVAEALAEGVRAQGAEFAQDTYRALLERASLAEIKRFRDDWAAVAATRFAGGRQTVDTEEQGAPREATGRQVPDAAYAG